MYFTMNDSCVSMTLMYSTFRYRIIIARYQVPSIHHFVYLFHMQMPFAHQSNWFNVYFWCVMCVSELGTLRFVWNCLVPCKFGCRNRPNTRYCRTLPHSFQLVQCVYMTSGNTVFMVMLSVYKKCESSLKRLHSLGMMLLLTKFIGYDDNDDRMMENGNFWRFLLFLQLIAYENEYNIYHYFIGIHSIWSGMT